MRYLKLSFSGINIVTHPHSPQGYVELLAAAFRERASVIVRGSQHLMIGALRPLYQGEPLKGLQGSFYRFIQVDKNASWFNVSRHDEATLEELSRINIPDDLRPNTETFDFVFYPKGHTLYYNRRSGTKVNGRRPVLGAGQVAKLLNEVFLTPSIHQRFGKVEVTVLPDSDQLKKILAIPKLTRLVIDVTRPNADELGKAQEKVFKKMEKMRARRFKEEIVAEQGESIVLDEDTKVIAIVAASNGSVEGYGYTLDDRRLDRSTTDKPWKETVLYNPEVQSEVSALNQATLHLPGHASNNK